MTDCLFRVAGLRGRAVDTPGFELLAWCTMVGTRADQVRA